MSAKLENVWFMCETGCVGTTCVFSKPCEFVGTYVIISLYCETRGLSHMRYHACVKLQMNCTVEIFVMLTAISLLQ